MDNYSDSEEKRAHSDQPINRGEDTTRGADGDRSLGVSKLFMSGVSRYMRIEPDKL